MKFRPIRPGDNIHVQPHNDMLDYIHETNPDFREQDPFTINQKLMPFYARITGECSSSHPQYGYKWVEVTPDYKNGDDGPTWTKTGIDYTAWDYAFEINGHDTGFSTTESECEVFQIFPTMNNNGLTLCFSNPVPKGNIQLWSGAIADIPDFYQLCNGDTTVGTKWNITVPDLRGRFVVSYDDRSSGALPAYSDSDYNTNAHTPHTTDGYRRHGYSSALGLDENNHADHDVTHYMAPDYMLGEDALVPPYSTVYKQHTMTDNRPPYFVLAYIIRL